MFKMWHPYDIKQQQRWQEPFLTITRVQNLHLRTSGWVIVYSLSLCSSRSGTSSYKHTHSHTYRVICAGASVVTMWICVHITHTLQSNILPLSLPFASCKICKEERQQKQPKAKGERKRNISAAKFRVDLLCIRHFSDDFLHKMGIRVSALHWARARLWRDSMNKGRVDEWRRIKGCSKQRGERKGRTKNMAQMN